MSEPTSSRVLMHSINNALASMRSAAELSLLGSKLSMDDKKNIEQIISEIDRLSGLLGELRSHLKE